MIEGPTKASEAYIYVGNSILIQNKMLGFMQMTEVSILHSNN